MVLLADRPIAITPELTPAQSATLSLLVRHGRSYDDVAGRVGGDPTEVRARAHGAVAALVGPSPHGSWDPWVIDQVLGQLPDRGAEMATQPSGTDEGTEQRELLAAALVRFGFPARLEDSALPGAEVTVAGVTDAEVTHTEVTVARVTDAGGVRGRQRTRTPMISARIRVMGSLGISLLVTGAILFLNGAH